MEGSDFEELARQRQLDENERKARGRVLAAYVQADLDGLAMAIIDAEGHRAIAELRRVNALLREHGFEHPVGAAGLADVFIHMGEVQLHEEEVPVALKLMRVALESTSLDGEEADIAQSIIAQLERAAGS